MNTQAVHVRPTSPSHTPADASARGSCANLMQSICTPAGCPSSGQRYDRLDTKGKMSFRRAGRMHHLHTGVEHPRIRVLAFADNQQVTVAELDTGEILSVHLIEPDRTYRRNQNKEPGRWPSSSS